MTLQIAQTTTTAPACTGRPDAPQTAPRRGGDRTCGPLDGGGLPAADQQRRVPPAGIPLTVAFQLFVRRRPLRELFAPATSRFAWDGKALAMAAAPATL
jgi:hypothetical protein